MDKKPLTPHKSDMPTAVGSAATSTPGQLPFSPSLLVAAAAAANAATAGSAQPGQLHPAYWTVFHQYLHAATSRPASDKAKISSSGGGSGSGKFSIEQLTSGSVAEALPLDLSMRPTLAAASRRSSLHSSLGSEGEESRASETDETAGFAPYEAKRAAARTSRRSDFNMRSREG